MHAPACKRARVPAHAAPLVRALLDVPLKSVALDALQQVRAEIERVQNVRRFVVHRPLQLVHLPQLAAQLRDAVQIGRRRRHQPPPTQQRLRVVELRLELQPLALRSLQLRPVYGCAVGDGVGDA